MDTSTPEGHLLIKVASPEGLAFSAPALSVELQTADGIIQVLPGHVDLATALTAGEMIIRSEKSENVFALGDGFASISADVITILADFAQDEASMVVDDIERAKDRAEAALRDAGNISEDERYNLEFTIRRSAIELLVKRKREKQSA